MGSIDYGGSAKARGVAEQAAVWFDAPSAPSIDVRDVRQAGLDLPDALSCRTGLTYAQRQGFKLLASGLGVSGLLAPQLLLGGLSALFWTVFATLILWRAALLAGGLSCLRRKRRPAPAVQDHDCPVYTVMIAAYDEAAVMPQLALAMRALDWPQDRLEIILLLEEDDAATHHAAFKAGFPKTTRILTVPDGQPRTKPRALNYGLARATGEFICVFDAEDRPHPLQLREAFAAFRASGPTLACVQAPLIGANADRSLLAAHWSLDYAVQFRLLLPALAALKAPIPIGGTSNHFRRSTLRAALGWDAYNVTEDADLGLRLARLEQRVIMIGCGTREDAPTQFNIWRKQRSRWIKGFLQTWLVLMRRPGDVARQMGWRNFAMMQVTLGGAVLAPIAHGPLFLFVFAACLSDQMSLGAAGGALLLTGLLVTLTGDLFAPGLSRRARLQAALTRPFYWPLHSLAAWTALSEMVTRPHYWAKTPHQASKDANPLWFTGSPASPLSPSSPRLVSSPTASSAPSANATSAHTSFLGG